MMNDFPYGRGYSQVKSIRALEMGQWRLRLWSIPFPWLSGSCPLVECIRHRHLSDRHFPSSCGPI